MPAPDYAEEIARLTTALASGEAEIRLPDGAMHRLRGVDEIQKAIGWFKSAASESSVSSGAPSRTSYASFERR